VQAEHTAEEVKRLQRCINDLISVLALPALWSGGEPSQVGNTLLDALLRMLLLDLVYVRLQDPGGEGAFEAVRLAHSPAPIRGEDEICAQLARSLADNPLKQPARVRSPLGEGEMSVLALPLGLQGEFGVIAVGSQRADFPLETECLLLSVAANQASLGLQEARRLTEQKRLASELDRRVAQRTTELAATNEELRREIAERQVVEEKLQQEERELKRSEARLGQSEALLAEVQRLSSTGGISWQVEREQVTFSEEAYRIFEFERGGPMTLARIASRVHPDDLPLLTELLAAARGDAAERDHEFRLRMPDGSVKYLRMISHEIRDPEGRVQYVGAIQDVTRRRVSEEALGKARAELAHVSRVTTLGILTASIAHELNQPLSGILTNAGTCLRLLGEDPPRLEPARETTRRTIRDANRASEVITRLRALFSHNSHASESVDLNEAVLEVIALSWTELQKNRVTLRPELAADLPLVTGDRLQLQQVMLNLLRNGSDAMSAVEDRPRQLLVRTGCDEGDRVRLTVQDAGVGFDPRAADRLFDAFYTTKSDGMGIGLSVSRSIIEAHHGRLWATLNEGPGAAFSFSIPRG
jgi:signal transduction histidine kinase